ncbi:hypothetical protein LZG75_01020 [Polynucleobacter sp. IMCC30063]|uniref:hypothetical protein n=1 Tax=unclassified Polynucleobacter TaxID=2640945 RepID=UPI001F235DB6|nr:MULTISPECIES: hypothetical protein [unclassified Polynucleobacter]MCE7504818.1 hypothetical protein [Polynucleobacter sp. IMCC30063]MCE7526378.1 hypothetical protein [Polynucleobacter sp. IMCC 30228]MCE7529664.1 hypothetical protein [Polynucleobacter sp. IMCC 29146]
MNQKKNMTMSLAPIFITLGMTACANIVTNASNSNQVTLISSGTESMEKLTEQANAYCVKYGKKASFKENESQFVNIFNCN